MTQVKDNGNVEFRFFGPGAGHVTVAGDFNGRSEVELDMQPQCDGWWIAEGQFKPGEYRFRYMCDGRWFTDFMANGFEYGPEGWNSLLIVPV